MVVQTGAGFYVRSQAIGHSYAMPAPTAATSPAGTAHPGTIVSVNHTTGEQTSQRADQVPQSIGWVNVDEEWKAVIRIEAVGGAGAGPLHLTRFGADGLLDTISQAPR